MPPAPGDWQTLNGEVRHTFTHFHLRLRPMVARLPQEAAPRRGHFVAKSDFRSAKAFTLSKPWFEEI